MKIVLIDCMKNDLLTLKVPGRFQPLCSGDISLSKKGLAMPLSMRRKASSAFVLSGNAEAGAGVEKKLSIAMLTHAETLDS